MRLISASIAIIVFSSCSFGQATVSYTIQTLAGNGTAGYSGDNGAATSGEVNDPFGVAADGAGNVYIADYGNNRIRKVSGGVITTAAGNGTQGFSGDNGAASGAELNSPIGVAVDSAGNLYIADTYNQRVRKVANGVITTVAGNGTAGYSGDNGPATSAQLSYPWAVTVDSAGNLYIADYGNNRIRKVSGGVITTVVGSGAQGSGGDGGAATNAQLYAPSGVALDGAGNLYIADYGNNRIREVSKGLIATVAGNGTAGYSGDNGPATSAELRAPRGVAVDAAGNLFISDCYNNRIREVSSGVIFTVAGTGNPGYSGDNGAATSAQLYDPTGVALGVGGALYIADIANARIRVLVPSGAPACTASVSPLTLAPGASGGDFTVAIQTSSPSCTWAVQSLPSWITVSGSSVGTGSGSATLIVATNPGAARTATISIAGVLVQINQSSPPCSYALAFGGQAFSAVGGNGSVGVIASSWCPWTASSAASWVTVTGGASGAGNGTVTYHVAANSGGAQSTALTIAGLAFALDQSGAATITIPTFNINTFAGNGTLGYSGDNGPATSSEMNNPTGVAVDSAGNVYIADKFNMRVRKVSKGTITTVAGNGGIGYTGDGGQATSAQLYWPSGVALDAAGNLYIADSGNNVIRKVSNGVITTVAGNGTFNYNGDGGPATSAALNYPVSVAVDSAGNLYIADEANWRVRKVSNGVITTVAGDGTFGYTGDNGPATSAEIENPSGVALDAAGNLYIADSYANAVREVSNGTITTVAGNGTFGYTGDNGPATGAELYWPSGVALDAAGNLYIADYGNFRIRVVTNGVIATVAGNGTQGFLGDNGAATSAELSLPTGVAADAVGNLYIVDSGNNRVRVGAPTGVSCVATLTPFALFPATSGGSLSVGIQTGATCGWTVSGLPSWITVSGSASGTGSGSVSLNVAANAGAARTATITIAGVAAPVSQDAAACSYALAFGGQAFGVAGGTGSVGVTASSWCSWTASSPVSWVTVTSGGSGTGNGTVTYRLAANSGGAQTASLTIAGLPFGVEQASATASGLAVAGSMSQLASGGLWNTTITLVNTGATAAEMVVNFFDDNGNALPLPLAFPQNGAFTSAAPLMASTVDRVIGAGAQIVIQTTGVSSQTVVAGWAQVLANGTIDGSAVYVEATATGTQEAVVPVETRNPSAFVLPFNYTNGYQTGIALANLTNQTANIPVTLWDATGKSLQTATIQLAAYAHTSFMLADKYAVVGSQYGSMELDTPLGGQISAIGIRAAPNNAITTVPVVAAGSASNGSMTQLVSGGIWNIGIALVNTSTATAQVNLNFFDNNGAPLALPLLYPLTGTTSTTSQVTQSLAPDAQLVIQTTGASSQPTAVGWAQVVVTGGNVGGAAVYAETSPLGLQEASVTVETRNPPNAFVLPFNYTNGYLTGIAVANLTNQAVSIPVVLRDDTGAILGTAAPTPISLPANGHTSFMLADQYAVVSNHYGTLELDTSGGQISALGIRATSGGAITSVPVLAK